jgi:hypothetical protein
MSRYLHLQRFKDLTVMPAADVDTLEALETGWIQRRIDFYGVRLINARLTKRYAVPFGGEPGGDGVRTDVPLVVEGWLVDLVTRDAYFKRGFNPSSAMDEAAIIDPAKRAELDVLEAANAETGLYELPLRASSTAGGVSKGGPLGYTETSPYVGFDLQRSSGREEDGTGAGT